MNKLNSIQNIINIERLNCENLGLCKIIKSYCENENSDYCLSDVLPILDIIIKNQEIIGEKIDELPILAD